MKILWLLFFHNSRFQIRDTIHYNKQDGLIYKSNELFIEKNPNNITDKDVISLSPGGLNGFYMAGVSSFLKDHYDLSNCVFTGASAGAWNALFMCCNRDHDTFIDKLFETQINLKKLKTTEENIKHTILSSYSATDFDFEKLYIGVTSFHKYHVQTHIYNHFYDLEDAIDCCIASSHIPFLTGDLLHIYNGINSFDGGFSNYPYLHIKKPLLHITPDMWHPKQKSFEKFYRSFFPDDHHSTVDLYTNGYSDSLQNKHFLDSLFCSRH
jgi:hypothetical protein